MRTHKTDFARHTEGTFNNYCFCKDLSYLPISSASAILPRCLPRFADAISVAAWKGSGFKDGVHVPAFTCEEVGGVDLKKSMDTRDPETQL